jgi:DNA-binding MarR family transcriptional regulator
MKMDSTEYTSTAELRTVFGELIRFETELWNTIDARLRTDCGLPLAMFEPMRVVSSRSGCRVNDVSDELAITVGGASKIIDRLELLKYCRRKANPDDRRSSVIELTAAGKRLLTKATAIFDRELEQRIATPLTARQRTQFTATLVTLRAAMREADLGADAR